MTKPKKIEAGRLSLREVAAELGVSVETVKRRLQAARIPTDAPLRWRLVLSAWCGDANASRARLLAAQAEVAELELGHKRGDLMNRAEVEEKMRSWFLPVREFVASRADRLASLVNPADPDHAHRLLEADLDRELELFRDDEKNTLKPV